MNWNGLYYILATSFGVALLLVAIFLLALVLEVIR